MRLPDSKRLLQTIPRLADLIDGLESCIPVLYNLMSFFQAFRLSHTTLKNIRHNISRLPGRYSMH